MALGACFDNMYRFKGLTYLGFSELAGAAAAIKRLNEQMFGRKMIKFSPHSSNRAGKRMSH